MTPLLLIHGFAGSKNSWNVMTPFLEKHFEIYRIDLPGHGDAAIPKQKMSLEELGEEIAEFVLKKFSNPVIVCGYSMGARVALHAVLSRPEFCEKLILIGGTAGIPNENEREQRRAADQVLALNIRKRGTEWFTDYWESLPMFDTQRSLPEDLRAQIRRDRLSCSAEGLAYALENWSPGAQRFLAPELKQIKCPLLLIAGQLDTKFCEINKKFEAVVACPVKRVEIANAGHAAHLENPRATADEIIKFISHSG